jgi:hypothetical protein
MNRTSARVAAVLACFASLALPAAASASDKQISIMMDDDRLVYRDDTTRDATLRQMAAIGADYVRVTLLWSVVARDARSTKARDKRFRRLKASNPKAYPKLNWDRYDRLVRAGRTLGIGIYFNITGPGPKWGHKKPPSSESANRRTWKPKPREFYKFVQAVGKRYSGAFRDENDGRLLLPRVTFWSLWNEPGQGGWLTPQYENGRAASPALYRELYIFGHKALESTTHARDIILAGETSPVGGPDASRDSRSAIRPKEFIREMFCLDPAGNPYTGAEAAARICGDFDKYGPLQMTAWAHHPYTKKTPPTERDAHPDSVTMANIDELPALLDQVAATTGRVAPNLTVISSEFGYETNPPDPYQGVDLQTQANWMNLGDFLAFQSPRVIGQTQFVFQDVPPLRRHAAGSKAYWFTYQSGIVDLAGQRKPSYIAYAFPFLAYPTGIANPETGKGITKIWGQLKFRPNNLPPEYLDVVTLQFKPADGSSDWAPLLDGKGQPVSLFVTNPVGFFLADVDIPAPGLLRAHWEGGAPPFTFDSREFPVS